MRYLLITLAAVTLTGCHYKYHWDCILDGEGGMADKCPKKCECQKEKP